jgi:hypothetical protein
MGLTTIKKIRPILITGKPGTGKSQRARTFCEDPYVMYANEVSTTDIGSIPIEGGIIIEDVHFKPKKEEILHIMRRYKGQIVFTSINEKSVPKDIKDKCQIKRAGRVNHLRERVNTLAPNSEEPVNKDMDVYSLVMTYMKMPDRDKMAELLKHNKPADTQIILWLSHNIHPNRLLFVDGVVKRRWSSDYFYELLSYIHPGNSFGRLQMPKRNTYSKIPPICRKLGVEDERLLRQLLLDDEFKTWAMKKLNHGECRLLGLGEKRRRRKTDPVVLDVGSLDNFM